MQPHAEAAFEASAGPTGSARHPPKEVLSAVVGDENDNGVIIQTLV
jgi:hypothetical protein